MSKINYICPKCGKEFSDYKSNNRKSCSNTCKIKGRIPWNKGLAKDDPRVNKYIQASANARRGRFIKMRHTCLFCGKEYIGNNRRKYCSIVCFNKSQKGKKHSTKWVIKASNARRGITNGIKCHFWKGGISPLRKLLRLGSESRSWTKQIFQRDNYTCIFCGQRGGVLHSHHVIEFEIIFKDFLKKYNQFSPIEDKETLVRLAQNHNSFWDINNGITLCKKCHKEAHKKYLEINKGNFENIICLPQHKY